MITPEQTAKREAIIDYLVELGYLFKEESSDWLIMKKPVVGFSYLEKRIAIKNDSTVVSLGVGLSKEDMAISTFGEVEAMAQAIQENFDLVIAIKKTAEVL